MASVRIIPVSEIRVGTLLVRRGRKTPFIVTEWNAETRRGLVSSRGREMDLVIDPLAAEVLAATGEER